MDNMELEDWAIFNEPLEIAQWINENVITVQSDWLRYNPGQHTAASVQRDNTFFIQPTTPFEVKQITKNSIIYIFFLIQVYLLIKKVFDLVNHKILLEKLNGVGVKRSFMAMVPKFSCWKKTGG